MFRILYFSCIRPHLEHCVQAASPYLTRNPNALERVQRVGHKISEAPFQNPLE